MSYRKEKLYLAVSKLATGTGTLRERFEEAYVVALANLCSEDFPEEELQQQLVALQASLSTVLPIAERAGALSFAMDALSEERLQELAEQVLWLFQQTIQIEESTR
ncbi:MAG: hypothetical protein ACFCVA_13210 [Gammaproteobacteria bacterium]